MTEEDRAKVLPPLPEPAYTQISVRAVVNSDTPSLAVERDITIKGAEAYTADQMREYALAAIMRKEQEPKETYGFEEWQVLALRAGWICPTPKTEPISDAEIFDIAGNYDCGTNGENMEWTFKSQKELLDFSRALLEKAR